MLHLLNGKTKQRFFNLKNKQTKKPNKPPPPPKPPPNRKPSKTKVGGNNLSHSWFYYLFSIQFKM